MGRSDWLLAHTYSRLITVYFDFAYSLVDYVSRVLFLSCPQRVVSPSPHTLQTQYNMGYHASDSYNFLYATDINECALGTDKCDQLCTNTQGGYVCSCNDGYELHTDGLACSGTFIVIICNFGLAIPVNIFLELPPHLNKADNSETCDVKRHFSIRVLCSTTPTFLMASQLVLMQYCIYLY